MKKIFILPALFFASVLQLAAQETTKKAEELKEVTITKSKKAIEQRADRTIFDFANQPSLNSGSVLEGLKKLPGLIASDIAGMMYQGKQLEVFMDGRPLNISSNELNGFLEGMPANAIERIEIITQPAASPPATVRPSSISPIPAISATTSPFSPPVSSTPARTSPPLQVLGRPWPSIPPPTPSGSVLPTICARWIPAISRILPSPSAPCIPIAPPPIPPVGAQAPPPA